MTERRPTLSKKDLSKEQCGWNFPTNTLFTIDVETDHRHHIKQHLDEKDLLAAEHKRCRHKSRGTMNQLLIDKTLLADSKNRHPNLTMAWVDNRKIYNMVPHA